MTSEELQLLIKTLFRIKFFSAFASGEIDMLVGRFHKFACSKGKIIIRENQPGEAFYVIYKGAVAVLKKQSFFKKKTVATLSAGDYFGEIALVSDEPTSATVKAVEESVLFVLFRHDFQEILRQNPKLTSVIRSVADGRKLENKLR
ncbi:MAG: cyclic nucleotide-binding domain-containing protein [bacterium]